MSPPHAPCSPWAGAVAWPPPSLATPLVSYTNRFTPHLARAGLRRVCSLLPSCVTHRLPSACPRLRFRGAAFQAYAKAPMRPCCRTVPGARARAGSREVPLGCWPQRRLVTRLSGDYTTSTRRRVPGGVPYHSARRGRRGAGARRFRATAGGGAGSHSRPRQAISAGNSAPVPSSAGRQAGAHLLRADRSGAG